MLLRDPLQLMQKKTLKNFKPESRNLPGEIWEKFSLKQFYACTRSNCGPNVKGGHVSTFWIRNGSVRIKLSNESVSMITHSCDLEKLFPGNPLIEDN